MDRTYQWECLEGIGFLRRRPVRISTEELEDSQEKQDNPKPMEVLPECQDVGNGARWAQVE